MSEVINTNVFAEGKKFIDFSGLQYFWNKTKGYVDAADNRLSGKITVNENAIKAIQDELNSLSGGAGSIQTQINNAITALDLPNTYEAKGSAATAEQNAKDYADGLADNYEVAGAAAEALESAKSYTDDEIGKLSFDPAGTALGLVNAHASNNAVHITTEEREAWNAAKDSIDAFMLDATVGQDAVDTLKELQAYMASDGAAATALVGRVAALEAIDHDAYISADEAVLAAAQEYVDGKVDGKFDTVGSAAQALVDAKAYTDEEIGKLSYDVAGAAAKALEDAKAYTDGKDTAMDARVAALEELDHSVYAKAADVYVKSEVVAAVEAAKNAAIADAATKLADYYTKTEVTNLLSTNSQADQAYAKTYTDALFNSMKFAANSDIDALF